VRAAGGHPSPVVQSSQIDSCVHEDPSDNASGLVQITAAELWTDGSKPVEYNNNIHWLKASDINPAATAAAVAVQQDPGYQLPNPVN